jgi:hypothetical protein
MAKKMLKLSISRLIIDLHEQNFTSLPKLHRFD